MPKINTTTIRKLYYTARHSLLTFNNLVIFVAFLIAAGWVWGSLQVMQQNYALQREVDQQARQLQLVELQRDSLELEKRYYQTREYQELASRESLGLVMPGEKVLILPPNSAAVKAADAKPSQSTAVAQKATTNLEQWMNFLFGGYSQSLGGDK